MACPNCGKEEAHFAPPSLGEEGFFICSKTFGGLERDPTAQLTAKLPNKGTEITEQMLIDACKK